MVYIAYLWGVTVLCDIGEVSVPIQPADGAILARRVPVERFGPIAAP